MAFIGKMETVDKKRLLQDKKNCLRRQYRQQAREALFIQDYVQHKYPEAYEEAATFYNYVNSIYPTKNDLRKTDEFKALKMGFTFVAKNGDNVIKKPVQVFQSISNLSQQNFTITCYKMQETITEQTATEIEQTATETEQTATETEQTTTETEQTATEIEQTATKTEQAKKVEKTVQLRIPLMPPELYTQTEKIITQEIVEENPLTAAYNQTLTEDIEPILNEEIPQEAFETILAELRQDPDLSKIMEDIEIDMEVDLPLEDDRLEQELYNLW